ncbi:MAG: hypothetical protein AB2L14_06270 [Candidatus Xenobiia bacterium LiM19]
MKLQAKIDNRENREYWTFVERVSNEVRDWPESKKSGLGTICEKITKEVGTSGALQCKDS